jgi:hypothetical protein
MYSEKDRNALIIWLDSKKWGDKANKTMIRLTPKEVSRNLPGADPCADEFYQTKYARDSFYRLDEGNSRQALLDADDPELRRLAAIINTVLPWPNDAQTPLTSEDIRLMEEQSKPWDEAYARLTEIAEAVFLASV